jgi:hypothetical protein
MFDKNSDSFIRNFVSLPGDPLGPGAPGGPFAPVGPAAPEVPVTKQIRRRYYSFY